MLFNDYRSLIGTYPCVGFVYNNTRLYISHPLPSSRATKPGDDAFNDIYDLMHVTCDMSMTLSRDRTVRLVYESRISQLIHFQFLRLGDHPPTPKCILRAASSTTPPIFSRSKTQQQIHEPSLRYSLSFSNDSTVHHYPDSLIYSASGPLFHMWTLAAIPISTYAFSQAHFAIQ